MKTSVFDWILGEPKPPHSYVVPPEPVTTAETFAIHSRGLKPKERLKIAATPAVLCMAPKIPQKQIMKRAEGFSAFERLQVAAYAPSSRLSVECRLRLVAGEIERNVLVSLRPEIPFQLNAYTLIYRPDIRWRYKKAREASLAFEDRIYVAAMAPGWAAWKRTVLAGKIVDPIAKEYFELKTGTFRSPKSL